MKLWFCVPRDSIFSEPSSEAMRPVFSQSQAVQQAVHQAGAIGVAAAGRVDHARAAGAGGMSQLLPSGVNRRALARRA